MKALLPSLYARDVVTYDEKKTAESKVLDTERMSYVLDLVIASLKADVPIKYNNFLKVVKERKDLVGNESVKNLGKLMD